MAKPKKAVKKKVTEKKVVEEQQSEVVPEPTADLATVDKEESQVPAVKEKMELKNAPLGAQELIDKMAEEAPMIAEGQNMLIVFPVGNEEYAIAIDDIKEVVPAPPIAIIPQVPDYVSGVANVRGNVLAVLDLSLHFAKKGTSNKGDESKFVLVIKSEEYQVAVNVNSVPNTIMVSDSEVDAPSNIISHNSSNVGYIKGIIKEGKRMIVWINIHEVLQQIYDNDLSNS